MTSQTGEAPAPSDNRGMLGPRLRIYANVVVYFMVSLQFVVILSILRQMRRAGPLSFGILAEPILFLGPLVMGTCFRSTIRELLRQGMVSAKAATMCNDWITTMLSFTYVALWYFRLLPP